MQLSMSLHLRLLFAEALMFLLRVSSSWISCRNVKTFSENRNEF